MSARDGDAVRDRAAAAAIECVSRAEARHSELVVVAPGEKTCRVCGETFAGRMCPRCEQVGLGEDGKTMRLGPSPFVRTVSYLNPGEYRIMG